MYKKEKETICWKCQNYSRCRWSDGKPVKGWKATPTVIVDKGYNKDEPLVVHSFLVEHCPHFKPDRKIRVYYADIAAIIGVSERRAHGIKAAKGIGKIKDLLKEKGYILHVVKDEKKCLYFLEKINDT